uniref:DUF4371 domain-containing protein n=1 Tax=Ditylenchus dipsaci TaxID=166011 RepID=A0A915EHK7_9BILA
MTDYKYCGQLVQEQSDSSSSKESEVQKQFEAMEIFSSSILSKISKIRHENRKNESHCKKGEDVSVLHNHHIHFDDVMRKVGIEAELRDDCLERGSDLTESTYKWCGLYGVVPGDHAVQIIDKRLGGPGHSFNSVPWNAKVDLSTWKDSEKVIYNHLKCSNNNSAIMQFAFEYDDESENEFSRPIRMYYHFTFLTAHGINEEWERVKYVLAVRELSGSHTGVQINLAIKRILEKWDIKEEQCHVFLRDGAASMKKAFENSRMSDSKKISSKHILWCLFAEKEGLRL